MAKSIDTFMYQLVFILLYPISIKYKLHVYMYYVYLIFKGGIYLSQ